MILKIYIFILLIFANINLLSQTELIDAIRKVDTIYAINLINKGVDVNEYIHHKENHQHNHSCTNHNYNRSPLFWATIKQEFYVVNKLIEAGANINFKNTGGKTALMMAVQTYNYKITELLLNNNANLYIADNYGNTAISIAKKAYNVETNPKIKQKIKKVLDLLEDREKLLNQNKN